MQSRCIASAQLHRRGCDSDVMLQRSWTVCDWQVVGSEHIYQRVTKKIATAYAH